MARWILRDRARTWRGLAQVTAGAVINVAAIALLIAEAVRRFGIGAQ